MTQLTIPLTGNGKATPGRGPNELERQPILGAAWMSGQALFFSLTNALTKEIYSDHPNMTSIEVIFHRCNLQIIFFLALINVNIKKLLWDDVPREILPELINKML